MLDDSFKNQLRSKFSKELKGKVKLILFGEGDDCTFCVEYRELVDDIASLSEKLSAEHHPLSSPEREKYGVEVAPSLVIYSEEHGTSATFCGALSGHFFATFLEDLADASRGGPNIPKGVIEKAKSIDFPVKIRVLVSHTCPYCPPAVKVAHDFSLINPKIKAEMIDASLFPQLRQRYQVMGVPKTVINDRIGFSGARPSEEVLEEILKLKGSQ